MADLLLFVYGSLRRDAEGRHHPLLRGAAYRGPATTRGRLYRVTWHPGLHPSADGGLVIGELFAIPSALREEMVRNLHAYEGPDFQLDPITASTTDGTAIAAATYTWLGDASNGTLLSGGEFDVPPLHPA